MTDTAALSAALVDISTRIDRDIARDEGQLWHRVAKVAEECGEVVEALIGVTGRNPRKGVSHSIADVVDELLDVAISALGAIEHIHVNPPGGTSLDLLADKAARVKQRIEAVS